MRGVIVKNRYYKDEGTDYVFKRLAEEFRALSVDVELTDAFEILERESLPRFAVYWDKDYASARLLEKRGVRVFNPSASIMKCDDKYVTMAELDGEVEFAETVTMPMKYPVNQPKDVGLIERAEKLGYPLVAKFSVGSLGNGVFLIKDRDGLEEFYRKNADCGRIMFQKYIADSRGRDVRIYVVGGKFAGAVKRVNRASFKSNAEAGAVTENFAPNAELVSTAEKVGSLLGLDYGSVDFFDTKTPIVNEVNSNAYFKDAERLGKINIARKYAEYVREVASC